MAQESKPSLTGAWRYKTDIATVKNGTETFETRIEGIMTIDEEAGSCSLVVTQHSASLILGSINRVRASTLDQTCALRVIGKQILIRSELPAGDHNWSPDHFDLWLDDSGDVMTGRHISNPSADAEFHRVDAQTGPLIATLQWGDGSQAWAMLDRDGYTRLPSLRNRVAAGFERLEESGSTRDSQLRILGENLWSGRPFFIEDRLYSVDCTTGTLELRNTVARDQKGRTVHESKTPDARLQAIKPTPNGTLYALAEQTCRGADLNRHSLAAFERAAVINELETLGWTVLPEDPQHAARGTAVVIRNGSWVRFETVGVGHSQHQGRPAYRSRWTYDLDCTSTKLFARKTSVSERDGDELHSHEWTAAESFGEGGLPVNNLPPAGPLSKFVRMHCEQ